jgi:hypothetical protein
LEVVLETALFGFQFRLRLCEIRTNILTSGFQPDLTRTLLLSAFINAEAMPGLLESRIQ